MTIHQSTQPQLFEITVSNQPQESTKPMPRADRHSMATSASADPTSPRPQKGTAAQLNSSASTAPSAQTTPLPVNTDATNATLSHGWTYFLTCPRGPNQAGTHADRSPSDLWNYKRPLLDLAKAYAGTEDLDAVPLSCLARDLHLVLEDAMQGAALRLGQPLTGKPASNFRSALKRIHSDLAALLKRPGIAPKAGKQLREELVRKGRYLEGHQVSEWPKELLAEIEAMRAPLTDRNYVGPGDQYFNGRVLRETSWEGLRQSLNQYVKFVTTLEGLPRPSLRDLVHQDRFLRYRQHYFKHKEEGGHYMFRRVCSALSNIARYLRATGQWDCGYEVTSQDPSAPWSVFTATGKLKMDDGLARKEISSLDEIPVVPLVRLMQLAFTLRDLPFRTVDGRQPSSRQVFRRLFAAAFFGLGVFLPLRGLNWRNMRWGRNLKRLRDGRYRVYFSPSELKNGMRGREPMEYDLILSSEASAWIEWWREQLKRHVGPDFEEVTPYVFPMLSTLRNANGEYQWTAMSHKYLIAAVDEPALELLGHRFRPHALRHSVATHIVSGGRMLDAQQAATLLGDTLATVLRVYFKPDKQKILDENYYAELAQLPLGNHR